MSASTAQVMTVHSSVSHMLTAFTLVIREEEKNSAVYELFHYFGQATFYSECLHDMEKNKKYSCLNDFT